MKPLSPNETIIEIEVVKRGETSGSSAAASSTVSQCRPRPPRTAVSANRKPGAVPSMPTAVARIRLLTKAAWWLASAMVESSGSSVRPLIIDEGALQQVCHREEHEQQQQNPDRRDGAEQRRVGRDPAP